MLKLSKENWNNLYGYYSALNLDFFASTDIIK